MRPRLKSLNQQVIVITGASSGIGLATARMAARRGAHVVLAARNEDDLRRVTAELTSGGLQATYVVADVAHEDAVERIAQEAVDRFGRIDTWVNNAAVSIYGRIEETALGDARRLFDVDFWGTVHGSRVALRYIKREGGALINVGSVVSDRAVPLQGFYCASKQAVKGFTDTLRMEVEKQGLPVAVTLVKPAAIDTPYFEHAKNYMEEAPYPLPPVYAPELVADVILQCAERPTRDITVGGGGRMLAMIGGVAPRLTDRYMKATMFRMQKSGEPDKSQTDGALHVPGEGGAERGRYRGRVMRSSLYTRAAMSQTTRVLPAVAIAAAVAAGANLIRARAR